MACKSVLIKCQNVQKFLRRRNSQIKGSRSSIYAAFVEATTVGKHLIAEKFNCKCKRGDLRENAFRKRLILNKCKFSFLETITYRVLFPMQKTLLLFL